MRRGGQGGYPIGARSTCCPRPVNNSVAAEVGRSASSSCSLTPPESVIAFVAVAGIVGILVDVLARQGLQAARAQAAAESVARVVADVVAAAPDALGDLAGILRRSFDLTAVALLRPTGSDWHVDATAGQPILRRPEEATRAIELPDHRVLALLAAGPSALDTGLLDALVAELRLAGKRLQLERLRRSDARSARPGDESPL